MGEGGQNILIFGVKYFFYGPQIENVLQLLRSSKLPFLRRTRGDSWIDFPNVFEKWSFNLRWKTYLLYYQWILIVPIACQSLGASLNRIFNLTLPHMGDFVQLRGWAFCAPPPIFWVCSTNAKKMKFSEMMYHCSMRLHAKN